jgi:biotin carboxyl carrier protein
MKNYKFTIDGTQYEADILSVEGNIARININGTPYEVFIQKEVKAEKTPILIRSEAKEPARQIEKKSGGPRVEIRSPLPGVIIKIFVKPGEAVQKKQKLFILEAMKMENEIRSERDGTITAIKTTIGQSVLQEEIIMEMD